MRLRNEKAETGHLLSFISKKDRSDNFSLFFPVEGLEQFDTLLEVTKGFEKCLKDWPYMYNYMGYSISDYGDIEKTFPEIDTNRIFFFEQSEFLSKSSQFIASFGQALLKRFVQRQNQIFPNIVTGAMSVGSDFYDREADVRKIWDALKNNQNVLLRAPRRFGKTSLLNHMAKHPHKEWKVCFVDLEGGDSAEKFVEKILVSMFDKAYFESCLPVHLAGQKIHSKTESVQLAILKEERQTIQKDWKQYAEELFTRMENSSKDGLFLVVLDEASFLIEDMLDRDADNGDKVSDLMDWFCNLRKKLKRIRFIVSGSEHLPSFLKARGIESHLNDLKEEHLDLFEKEIAKEFIFLALSGQKIVATFSEINLFLDLMGKPIPYFLHLFLDAICKTCKENRALSLEEIESVYYHHLLGSNSKRYFESITSQLERYKRYGPRNTAGAKSILDSLSTAENPVTAEELKIIWQETTGSSEQFDIILDIMQDDFYLTIDESLVSIDSKLIKDWWRKYGIGGLR